MRALASEHLVRVTEDLAMVQLPIVNAFIFHQGGRWTLIDAGTRAFGTRIFDAARELVGPDVPPDAVILTHGHFDHVGMLEPILSRWDVPVYAHPLEMPYLAGRASYPPPDPTVGGGLVSLLSVLFPRGPIDVSGVLRSLPENGSVPGMTGWRWLHTPGHSPGHVSLFREDDRLLIAGDAFVTTKQESFTAALARPVIVSNPPAYYTVDWPAARRSIALLRDLTPVVAVTGHGLPVAGERLDESLDALSRYQPASGRYVESPAAFDSEGVVYAPRPVIDDRIKVAVAAIAVGAVIASRTSTDERAAEKSELPDEAFGYRQREPLDEGQFAGA